MAPLPAVVRERPTFIREYRVEGSRHLPRIDVESAVYPFLGPSRTSVDVKQARAALEQAYKDKGFLAVTVSVPDPRPNRGIVIMEVTEATVGRLRVHGSRYFSLADIKKKAPSMAEGIVPNSNDITRDVIALNQVANLRVNPELKAGIVPGTVDIDLTVKDTLPLHGSLELNNRSSPDTTALRLNASLSYGNLWQKGHTIGASMQISPEDPSEVKVFSGYYQAKVPKVDWLSLMVIGTKQDSNVSTLGGAAVAGRGEILGARAMISLPQGKDFYHSMSLGADYKHFDQNVGFGVAESITTPITYYPFSVNYSATWSKEASKEQAKAGSLTEFNAGVTFHFRGLGSDQREFDDNRFRADGSFIVFKGDLAHTRDLPKGFELYAKVQGQISDKPLVSSEQLSGGGLGTVRGYLEAEVVGDSGVFGTLEVRSPSLLQNWAEKVGEWRLYAFIDAGLLTLHSPLPEQQSRFEIASLGLGSRVRVKDHLSGSIDAGYPLIGQSHTGAHDLLLTFRVSTDF